MIKVLQSFASKDSTNDSTNSHVIKNLSISRYHRLNNKFIWFSLDKYQNIAVNKILTYSILFSDLWSKLK